MPARNLSGWSTIWKPQENLTGDNLISLDYFFEQLRGCSFCRACFLIVDFWGIFSFSYWLLIVSLSRKIKTGQKLYRLLTGCWQNKNYAHNKLSRLPDSTMACCWFILLIAKYIIVVSLHNLLPIITLRLLCVKRYRAKITAKQEITPLGGIEYNSILEIYSHSLNSF